VHPFSGQIAPGATIPVVAAGVFDFVGGTTSVVLTGAAHISGAAALSLGIAAGSTSVATDLCYKLGSGPVTNFEPSNYVSSLITAPQVSVAAAGSVSLAAGSYTVGACVSNQGPSDLDANDYVSGWVMVTN
jgi:hypothetical protein